MSYGETLRKLGVTDAAFSEAVALVNREASLRASGGKEQPFRWVGRQVVSDEDWDFRSKLMRNAKDVATDTLEVLVFS